MTLLAPMDQIVGGVGVGQRLQDLSLIRAPGCAAAIWNRTAQNEALAWLATLPPTALPKARVVLPAGRVPSALTQIFDIAQAPPCPERDWLIEDASALAEYFAALMDAPYLRVRFDAITSNACRRFHVDALTARLICTYRGTGTQYGVTENGDDPTSIFTVPTGVPMILRGTNWPETPESRLRHRSPPIEGTGEVRSVLVLDPIYDLEDAD